MSYLEYEWQYVYTERIGIMCGSNLPTPEQKSIAIREANDHCIELGDDTFQPKKIHQCPNLERKQAVQGF